MSRRALVFGATGQIGSVLLPKLSAAGWTIEAVSRAAQPQHEPNITWHQVDLFAAEQTLPATDVVFSLGPLDGFVHWLERQPVVASRLVVFGSTSAQTKLDSGDDAERRLAHSLRCSEASLARIAAQGRARWTLLRPTLIYGIGRDRSLTRIAQLARRMRCFALPRGAEGLRQPVHVEDLAAAALQVVDCEATFDRCFDLPGGEALPYHEMVRRMLACLDPPPPLVALPRGLFALGSAILRRSGRLRDASAGVLQRLSRDLVFDVEPARTAFGYAPRGFQPHAAMFCADSGKNLLQRSTN